LTYSWREHADAVDEYRAAAHWYESRRPGLGEMFMDAVDAAIESILDPSITWGFYRDRKRTPQVYSRSVAGFPFDIVYVVLEGEVVIVAYAHERRRPRYWSRRLEG
jgi:toxin ParE1/3/4